MSDRDSLTGLGGWLILVGLGLGLTACLIAFHLWQAYLPAFTDGSWTLLTSPSSEHYLPGFAALYISEIAINILFLAGSVVLLVLFFRESSLFPVSFIVFYALNATFILVDAYAGSKLLPGEEMLDDATAREFGRSLISCSIWIPYMLRSRRVRNTFRAHAA